MARRSAPDVLAALAEGRYRVVALPESGRSGKIYERREGGGYAAYYGYQFRQGKGWSRVIRRHDEHLTRAQGRRFGRFMRRDVPEDFDWSETP